MRLLDVQKKTLSRARNTGIALLILGVQLVVTLIGLTLMEGGAILAYDAGVWPVGAILRISEWLLVLSFGLYLLVGLVTCATLPFKDLDE